MDEERQKEIRAEEALKADARGDLERLESVPR